MNDTYQMSGLAFDDVSTDREFRTYHAQTSVPFIASATVAALISWPAAHLTLGVLWPQHLLATTVLLLCGVYPMEVVVYVSARRARTKQQCERLQALIGVLHLVSSASLVVVTQFIIESTLGAVLGGVFTWLHHGSRRDHVARRSPAPPGQADAVGRPNAARHRLGEPRPR